MARPEGGPAQCGGPMRYHGQSWWPGEACGACWREACDFCTTFQAAEVQREWMRDSGHLRPLLDWMTGRDPAGRAAAFSAYRERREAAAKTGRARLVSALSLDHAPAPNDDWNAEDGPAYAAAGEFRLVTRERENSPPGVLRVGAAEAVYSAELQMKKPEVSPERGA